MNQLADAHADLRLLLQEHFRKVLARPHVHFVVVQNDRWCGSTCGPSPESELHTVLETLAPSAACTAREEPVRTVAPPFEPNVQAAGAPEPVLAKLCHRELCTGSRHFPWCFDMHGENDSAPPGCEQPQCPPLASTPGPPRGDGPLRVVQGGGP